MVQPRKRVVKRGSAVSSDGEEDRESPTADAFQEHGDDSVYRSSPKKLPSRARKAAAKLEPAQKTTQSATSMSHVTPRKQKQPSTKPKSPDQSKTRTLYSFFNKATESQLQALKSGLGNGGVSDSKVQQEEDDEIQDQISDDEDSVAFVESRGKAKLYDSTAQKRSFDGLNPHGIISGSQKYMKKADGTRNSPMTVEIEADGRTWNEKYGPSELSELVVHKKKVSDVHDWLKRSLSGHKYSKLLILKGTAGSGKTTTVSMLSKTMKFAITEWRNPTSAESGGDRSASVSAQLEDFLSRGSKFGGLELISTSAGSGDNAAAVESSTQLSDDHHILLMEEFPNNLTRATATLQTFRSTVLRYLEANSLATVPLVMVISETVMSESYSSVDNFTAHRLLGPEILHHPSAAVIEFNRVAPTFVGKALNIALRKRTRENTSTYQPSEAALKRLSEFGDVRNAVSTLEFLCTQRGKGEVVGDVKWKRLPGSKKKPKPAVTDNNVTEEELSIISLRESSIGLFHAVGRVLYNKRALQQNGADLAPENIPPHLSQLRRVHMSEVDLDSLIDETGTDTLTFLSALHENYVMSCFASNGDSEVTLQNIVNCSHSLADADILDSNHYSNTQVNTYSSGVRQSEICFQVGVRGLLFSLPYPVKRQPPPGKSKAAAHQMFYPASLKLWRTREEIQQLTDIFVRRAVDGTMLSSRRSGSSTSTTKPLFMVANSAKPSNTSQSSDEQDKSPSTMTPAQNFPNLMEEDDESYVGRVVVGGGHSARHEVLFERLPYMKQMFAKKDTWNPSLLKQVNQVVQFTGISTLQEEDSDEPDPLTLESNSSPKRSQTNAGSTKDFFSLGLESRNASHSELDAVEKLILSDDDIEDD